MFDTLCGLVTGFDDYPARAKRLECLRRVRDNELYDALPYEFYQEYSSNAGEYIPLSKRKPTARSCLCRVVVDDSVSFLFGEGRFPNVDCVNETTTETLRSLIKNTRLPQAMSLAATKGSIGSVVVLMRVLKGRVFWSVMDTIYLTPVYDPEAPDKLKTLCEKYKVKGGDLAAMGYAIPADDKNAWFWFEREWDAASETWFVPRKVSRTDTAPRLADAGRTVAHNLGFVPAVWVQNLPGGNEPDGVSSFGAGIETMIEIDYQLSQAGRGLKYSSDPKMVIKGENSACNEFVGGASNALMVDADGDAKMLEISGSASTAVVEYVAVLRETALEAMHGNRATPDRTNSAASGRALEIQHHALIRRADMMRSTYGETALIDLLDMLVAASARYPLKYRDGSPVPTMAASPIALRWPQWFPPGEEEKQTQANTVVALRAGGLMSQETGINVIASNYDIEKIAAELAAIKADEVAADAREVALAAQVQVKQSAPG